MPKPEVLDLIAYKRKKRFPQDPLRKILSLANVLESIAPDDPEVQEAVRILREKPQAALKLLRREQERTQKE